MTAIGGCWSLVFVAVVALGVRSVPAQSPPKPPPTPIKDLNSLSDGRGSNLANDDPSAYPLTASSYPDTPRVVGDRLYFLAHDRDGRRKLWCFNSTATAGADRLKEVKPQSAPPGGANPRLLTVFGSGSAPELHFVADYMHQDGVVRPAMFNVTGHTENGPIQFTGLNDVVSIDGLHAGPVKLTVLVADASGHHLYEKPAGASAFSNRMAAGATYSKAADLVAFGNMFAFTAEMKATAGPRALYVVDSSVVEIGVTNPSQLTAVGSALAMVDKGTVQDVLRIFDGYLQPAVATRDGIHGLVPGYVGSSPVLFFVSGINTAAPTLERWNGTAVDVLIPQDGGAVASVAAVENQDGLLLVLGVHEPTPGVRRTTIWYYDPALGKLVTVRAFPALTAAHGLHVFGDFSGPRAAFAALAADQSSPRPRLVVSPTNPFAAWVEVEVSSLQSGSSVDFIRRVGDYLFFRATEAWRGSEPWEWNFR